MHLNFSHTGMSKQVYAARSPEIDFLINSLCHISRDYGTHKVRYLTTNSPRKLPSHAPQDAKADLHPQTRRM